MQRLKCILLAAVAASTIHASETAAAPVLMISIDGLSADDLNNAEALGLEIPTLRALAASGARASGVRGVLPTITYPSHTTMITGVHPAKHGIVGNATFDPEGRNMGGWMWHAQDIKAPTLWDTVKAKGGTVVSLGWPVSVGKTEIHYNIPEFWRTRTPEDEKLLRAVSTPGMPDEMARATGVSFSDVALDLSPTHEPMDDARMVWVPAMIARYKPQLMTVHLVTLDGVRHKYGPYSPQAKAVLGNIDRGLKTMIDKARAAQPDLIVAIVSDHGFLPIGTGLNLVTALAEAGLVQFGENGKVESWDAFPWVTGGSAAIILKDPADQVVAQRVKAVLDRLSANPANGIDQIIGQADIAQLGGTAKAAFWVSMKSGYSVVGGASQGLQRPVSGGTHGYSPKRDEMLSVFLMNGPGIAQKDLKQIDMRDIAPTIGEVLGAPLPNPDGKVLQVKTVTK